MVMIKVIAIDFGGVYFTWNKEVYFKSLARVTKTDIDDVKKA